MKKIIIAVMLASTLLVGGLFIQPTFVPSADDVKTTIPGTNVTEFEIIDGYNYRLSEVIDRTPDSFEAWINMPSNSLGGTIMGNYYNPQFLYGGINWEVNAIGKVSVFWNDGALNHTFNHASINDGVWHHVAVIRDKQAQTFSLYIDGELKDSVSSNQPDCVGKMPYVIGTDHKNWTVAKTPFEGYIRQVTLYNGAISAERIAEDMQTNEITDTCGGQLIGNWYLGETWVNRTVEESSGSGIVANICTHDKHVGVANNDFEYDYMIVGIPDTQIVARYDTQKFYASMDYLAQNAKEQKMAFALQVGDLSDDGTSDQLFQIAKNGYSKLDGILPYSFVQGNHDYDDQAADGRLSVKYNTYFPYSKYSQNDHFGGAYIAGSMENYYVKYNIGGVKYLVLCLEFGPRMSVIRWAGRVCEAHPDHRVIVTTHAYVDPDGSIMDANARYSPTSYFKKGNAGQTTGTQLWEGLISRYSNIFMVFSGHNSSDDVVVRTDTGINGNKITSLLIDAQGTMVDGKYLDVMLMMKVNEQTKTMSCCWYSPYEDACFNIQNQFELSFADANSPVIGG